VLRQCDKRERYFREKIGARMMNRRGFTLGLLASPALAGATDGWDILRRGGVAALIRHARAPGTGDPPGFVLTQCATQRNLSDEGRAQARRLGEAFTGNRVPVGRVVSSRWCRALDTARLAFGDRTEPFPALDSFFSNRTDEPAQSNTMRALLADWRMRSDTLVCVTHQVNVTALTGIVPREGSVVIVRGGERVEVLAKIAAV
jgi:phosphohistidine phosphatase SixA